MNLLGDRKYFCITDRIQLLESFSFEHVYFDDGVYFVMTMSEHKSKLRILRATNDLVFKYELKFTDCSEINRSQATMKVVYVFI